MLIIFEHKLLPQRRFLGRRTMIKLNLLALKCSLKFAQLIVRWQGITRYGVAVEEYLIGMTTNLAGEHLPVPIRWMVVELCRTIVPRRTGCRVTIREEIIAAHITCERRRRRGFGVGRRSLI